jgi:hypothetical protein
MSATAAIAIAAAVATAITLILMCGMHAVTGIDSTAAAAAAATAGSSLQEQEHPLSFAHFISSAACFVLQIAMLQISSLCSVLSASRS